MKTIDMKDGARTGSSGVSQSTVEVESTFEMYGRSISVTKQTDEGRKLLEEGRGFLDTSKPILSSRAWKSEKTIVEVGNVRIGGDKLVVIAGPCAIESERQLCDTALLVKEAGASMLRGGAFKPRTSPYSFQGSGEEALRLLKRIGERLEMPVVSEILSEQHIGMFKDIGIDMAQIGARNAQNYALISAVAKSGIPIMLKRGPGSTIEEWLGAAEYALLEGNGNVVLCERGIRTFSNHMRYTLDIPGMVAAQSMTHLPIGADPSHAAGKTEFVSPLTLSVAGAGARFLIIEVHCNPSEALSDAEQQLDAGQFAELMKSLRL